DRDSYYAGTSGDDRTPCRKADLNVRAGRTYEIRLHGHPGRWTLQCCDGPEPKSAVATFELVQTIPLSGVEGRIDHMNVDVQRKRLFMAALGNQALKAHRSACTAINNARRTKMRNGLALCAMVLFLPGLAFGQSSAFS